MSENYLCFFAKALLNGQFRCKSAESFHIAERHGIQCSDEENHQQCETLANLLHEQSRFALGVTQLPQQATNNMELRVQCGGILGIQRSLSAEAEASSDIPTLIRQAILTFERIEKFPYPMIIQSVSQWKPHRRHRRR